MFYSVDIRFSEFLRSYRTFLNNLALKDINTFTLIFGIARSYVTEQCLYMYKIKKDY